MELKVIERAAAGDGEALGLLIERYRNQVYALAFHHLGDFEAAQDVAQEVFVLVFNKLPQLRDTMRFAGWLRVLTLNRCRMALRQREIATVPIEGLADVAHEGQPSPQRLVEDAHRAAEVRAAVAALPERERLAITMFYLGGAGYVEIAAFLGESIGAIESRLHRARGRLRERLINRIGESYMTHRLNPHFTQSTLMELTDAVTKAPKKDGNGTFLSRPEVWLHDEQARRLVVPLTEREAWTMVALGRGEELPRPTTQSLAARIWELWGIKASRIVLTGVDRHGVTARVTLAGAGRDVTLEAEAGDVLPLIYLQGAAVYATVEAARKLRRRARAAGVDVDAGEAAPTEQATDIEKDEARETYNSRIKSRLQRRRRRWRSVDWSKRPVVQVVRVAPDKNGGPVVVLSLTPVESEKVRCLAIWIGKAEARSIERALQSRNEEDRAFALTDWSGSRDDATRSHDFLAASLREFGIRPVWMALDDLAEQTYFSVLSLERQGEVRHVDARPSDATALALRFDCPLYAGTTVFAKAHQLPASADINVDDIAELQRQIWEAIDTTFLDVLIEALNEAARLVESSHTSARLVLTREPNGKCRHQVLNEVGGIVWERVANRVAQYRQSCDDFRNYAKRDTLEMEGDRKFTLSTTIEHRPRWRVELRLSPLPAAKPH